MRKITLVSLISILFLSTASAITKALDAFTIKTPLPILLIGIGILVVSALLAVISKKHILPNILCILISAIALGFCIKAWYLFRGFNNSFLTMLLVSCSTVVYLWVFYALAQVRFLKKYFSLFFWIFLIASIVGYLAVMLLTKTTYVSTFGFYMIVEIAFIFALCNDSEDTRSAIRDITVSTYSVFVVAVIIAIIMLSEGDCIDGDFIDITPDSAPENKKLKGSKKKNRPSDL